MALFPSFPRPVFAQSAAELQLKTGAAGHKCWAGKQASKKRPVRGIIIMLSVIRSMPPRSLEVMSDGSHCPQVTDQSEERMLGDLPRHFSPTF
jgi:hypothetical protein